MMRTRGMNFAARAAELPPDLVQHLAAWSDQLDLQVHLAERVRGATQARIVAADHRFDAVEHSRSQSVAMHIMFGYLQHAAVHGQVVVTRGVYQVDPANQPLLVDLVMMEQRPPRSFAGAHAFEG